MNNNLQIIEKTNQLEVLRAKAGLKPLSFKIRSEKVLDDLITYFKTK